MSWRRKWFSCGTETVFRHWRAGTPDKSCARGLIKHCQLIVQPSCSNKPTLIDRTLELTTRKCFSRALALPFSCLLLLALCHDKLLFLGTKITLRRDLIHETKLRLSRQSQRYILTDPLHEIAPLNTSLSILLVNKLVNCEAQPLLALFATFYILNQGRINSRLTRYKFDSSRYA